MKKLFVTGLLISASMLFAAEQGDALSSLASSKLSKKDFLRFRAGGGKVEKPGTKKGEIVVVNAQDTAERVWIEEQVAYFTRETHYNVIIKEGVFNIVNPEVQGNMTIFIVDDRALPAMLVAPENRWAIMNVDPLKDNRTSFFEARVKKEMSRTFSMLCGGMASNFQLSLMGPVTKTKDLDLFADAQIPFDIFNRMNHYLRAYGIEPALMVTYKKACEEGWAFTPTNDVQKAIWDEVHAMPTEPIKIKPEEKKTEK